MNEDEESVSISNQSSRMGHEGDDEEEDDITLQDLVAMETMDDADELDITSENSLQSEHELYQHLKGSHHTVKNDDSLAKSIKTLATGNRNDIFTSRYFGGSNVGDPIKSQITATARVSQNPSFQNTGRIIQSLFNIVARSNNNHIFLPNIYLVKLGAT